MDSSSREGGLIESSYCGPANVASLLYKNKWNATIGLLFGRYVKRFFVIKMEKQLFCYYDDIYYNNPHEYPVTVSCAQTNGRPSRECSRRP